MRCKNVHKQALSEKHSQSQKLPPYKNVNTEQQKSFQHNFS